MDRASTDGPQADGLPLYDRERLGALFVELEPRLRAVAVRITRHPEAARDAVQDAFVKVLLHGHRFAGRARVSTWMHRIVANQALMWLRTQRRRGARHVDLARDGLEQQPDPGPCPAERLSGRERVARLEQALDALSCEDRELMRCCGLAGESYAAYAARSGLHPAAVKSRAYRARRRLATLLGEGTGGESP